MEEELSLRFPACPLLSMLEAIKKEKPNRVKCDADEIDIYSQSQKESFAGQTRSLTLCRVPA